MSQLNFNINQSRISSMQILLGLAPIPERISKQVNVTKADEDEETKKDTRDKVNNRGELFYEKQKTLVCHVDSIVKSGVINVVDVWSNIEAIEEETGTEIFMRTKKGNLMSLETFRTYVLKSIRSLKARPLNNRDTIIMLFKSGKTEMQIRELVDCRHAHIHRCLVDAGLKMKRFTPTRNYNHNKRNN